MAPSSSHDANASIDAPPSPSSSQRTTFQAWRPSLYTSSDGLTKSCWRPRTSSSLTKRYTFHLPMPHSSLAARHRRLMDKRVIQHLPGWGAEPEGGIEETWKEIEEMNCDTARLAFDIQQPLPEGRELTEEEQEYLVQPSDGNGGQAYLAAGEIGILRYDPKDNSAEVGILLSPFSQGKGLLTEAMHYILSIAFAPSPSSSSSESNTSWAAGYTFHFPTTPPPNGLSNERAGLALSSIIIGTATTNRSMSGFAQHVLGARELSVEEMSPQQRKVEKEWKKEGSGLVVLVLTREEWVEKKVEERLRMKILQKKQE